MAVVGQRLPNADPAHHGKRHVIDSARPSHLSLLIRIPRIYPTGVMAGALIYAYRVKVYGICVQTVTARLVQFLGLKLAPPTATITA
jgi:hypothetical protein